MSGPNSEDYIFAAEAEREHLVIELLVIDHAAFAQDWLQPALGWRGEWGWYAIRIPTAYVLPPGVSAEGLPGDIDVMGGRLSVDEAVYAAALERVRSELPDGPGAWDRFASFECLEQGALDWPPPVDVIGAAEFKTSSVRPRGVTPRTARRLQKAYQQANGLTRMGFDRAAMIWVAASEPVVVKGVEDFATWMEAAARARPGEHAVLDVVDVREDQVFGQIVVGLGAVPGKLERDAGSLAPWIVRDPPKIDRTKDDQASAIRNGIERFLLDVFARYPLPKTVPIVIRACTISCGEVFLASPPGNRTCPRCGKLT